MVRAAAIAALIDLSIALAAADADDLPMSALGRLRVPDELRTRAVEALVQHRIVKVEGDRTSIPSYLELMGTAEERRARREAGVERMKRHRERRAGDQGGVAALDASAMADGAGSRAG